MKLIFAIKDLATETYVTPLFLRSRGEAMRTFTDAANDPQSMVSKHPEDYELYELGAFDEQTGEITSQDVPEKMARAKDLLTPKV